MVTDSLMATMGCTLILPVKVSINKIKGASHKNGDVDGMYKRSLTFRLL